MGPGEVIAAVAFAGVLVGVLITIGTSFQRWVAYKQRKIEVEAEALRTFRFRTARLARRGRFGVSYAGSFFFEICETGLRIRLLPMFSWISEPIFVPWELVATDGAFPIIGSSVYLGSPFIGSIWMSSRIARVIEQARNRVTNPAP